MTDYVPTIYLQGDDTEDPQDFSEPTSVYAGWGEFLPHQWETFSFLPPSRQATIAQLGSWGSGKTNGAAKLAVQAALMNPWTPAYGRTHPIGWIMAPTYKILKNATVQEFDLVCPPELIRKRVNAPFPSITFVNGFEYRLYSAKGSAEGENLCVVWMDEVQDPLYVSKFKNIQARIRDKHSPWSRMIVSGLPQTGFVREKFDRPDDPNLKTVLSGTRDNPHIPPETLRELMSDCPAGKEHGFLNKGWMAPEGIIYSQFNPSIHIIDRPIDYNEPIQVGMDVGNFGAVIIAQKIQIETKDVFGYMHRSQGLYIVDEILTKNEGVEDQCYSIRTKTPYQVKGHFSSFCVDPTIRDAEMNVIRRHFPGVRIVKLDRGDEFFPVENGIRLTQRALMDSLKNPRVYFHKKLVGAKLGVIEGIETYRKNDRGIPVKDNTRDHGLDAFRYLCCEHVKLEGVKMQSFAL